MSRVALDAFALLKEVAMFIPRSIFVARTIVLTLTCLCLLSVGSTSISHAPQLSAVGSEDTSHGIKLQAQLSGTVILRAVFAADGKVKYIFAIHPLDYGLTEQAIRAARQINFIPATINGKPVSQYIQIEYNFNLY